MIPLQLCLKTFHQAVAKLRSSGGHGCPDQSKMASILKSVLDMLAEKEGAGQRGPTQWGNKSIYVVAQSIQFGKHLHKVLQMGNSAKVHFIMFQPQLAEVGIVLRNNRILIYLHS